MSTTEDTKLILKPADLRLAEKFRTIINAILSKFNQIANGLSIDTNFIDTFFNDFHLFNGLSDEDQEIEKLEAISAALNEKLPEFCILHIHLRHESNSIYVFDFTIRSQKRNELLISFAISLKHSVFNMVSVEIYRWDDKDEEPIKETTVWMIHRIGEVPVSGIMSSSDVLYLTKCAGNLFKIGLNILHCWFDEPGLSKTINALDALTAE